MKKSLLIVSLLVIILSIIVFSGAYIFQEESLVIAKNVLSQDSDIQAVSTNKQESLFPWLKIFFSLIGISLIMYLLKYMDKGKQK